MDNKYPLPHITDFSDKLSRSTYLKITELANGFHQIEIEPSKVEKTVLSDNGHF